MKKENELVLVQENTVFTSVKTKKSIYDFNCDFDVLKFKASKKASEVLSMIYEACIIKRTIQVGTSNKLKTLDDMSVYALENNDIQLLNSLKEQYAIYSVKNVIVQSMQNKVTKRYYKPLIQATYKAYIQSFNDNTVLKKALKEWALNELEQQLDNTVLTWLCKLVGVKTNNVSRYNKSLLKFLNESEYAKIVLYALTELSLNKQQLSMKRMKDDIIGLNVMYNTFLQDIHVINEPKTITKKWLLYTIQCYGLSSKTKTELNEMTKDDLYTYYRKELRKRENLRAITID